jgi:hypothetical protein
MLFWLCTQLYEEWIRVGGQLKMLFQVLFELFVILIKSLRINSVIIQLKLCLEVLALHILLPLYDAFKCIK